MPKILVVDDLSSDRLIVGGLLSKEDDITVEFAVQGLEALEKIAASPPDLVLTDLQMPEMNGLELVQRIRQDHPSIPSILMTAKGSEEIAGQAIQQGAASYVPKKHLAGNLVDTVRRILAASSQERMQTQLMGRLTRATFVLENDLALLSSLVAHLIQGVQERQLCDDGDAIRIATGLDEALLNAYYHGNLEVDSVLKETDDAQFHELARTRLTLSPYAERRITVSVQYEAESATFVIRDEGRGFNPDDLPDPTDPEFLERPSGRGLLLMRSFMDDVSFNDVGNEVTLVKRRSEAS